MARTSKNSTTGATVSLPDKVKPGTLTSSTSSTRTTAVGEVTTTHTTYAGGGFGGSTVLSGSSR